MLDSGLFRRRLTARLVAFLGGAAAAPLAACSYDYADLPGGDGGGGGGATTISTTTTTTTSTGTTTATSIRKECFDVDLGTTCPAPDAALTHFLCVGGYEPSLVTSPVSDDGQCCYGVEQYLPCGAAGRPFVVEHQARVAPPQRGAGRRGWTAGSPPQLEGLTPLERAALADAWTADALLEHASIASFARVSLALLAAGAPATLVEQAHRAALDEVRHAGLCFALASAYAGEDVTPGRFPLGQAVHIEASLEAIAVSTVHEGCIGETVAAVIAAEQLARATDPAVRAALAEIAADEARHSELAWRTVAWAVDAGGPPVRAAVERALREALAAPCTAPEGRTTLAPAATMEAHGRLDPEATARMVATALATVVGPAARALLRRPATSPGPGGGDLAAAPC